ncbi:MAG: hypothetical protein RL308_1933 [Bacteroidota bacterium]|jgi:hypothetical protein
MKNNIQVYKDNNQKLTIILGSGYHVQGLGKKISLSNWGILLSKLTSSYELSNKYTIDFEQIIIKKTNNQDLVNGKQAHLIEKKELKHIANFIFEEQKRVLAEKDRFNYPDVFNPKYVSDVISLNFDHIAEYLCNMKYGNGETIIWSNESSFSEIYRENSTSNIYRTTSFRKITDNQGNEIRFWYPHGSILKPNTITLGINRYAKLVSDTMRIRDHYKKHERENSSKEVIDLTWYSQILKNPVLILGASFSEAEWDLWSAIVFKKRNYAKFTSSFYENDIYKMVDNKTEDKNLGYWYHPLFESKDFNEQWELIENALKD